MSIPGEQELQTFSYLASTAFPRVAAHGAVECWFEPMTSMIDVSFTVSVSGEALCTLTEADGKAPTIVPVDSIALDRRNGAPSKVTFRPTVSFSSVPQLQKAQAKLLFSCTVPGGSVLEDRGTMSGSTTTLPGRWFFLPGKVYVFRIDNAAMTVSTISCVTEWEERHE